MQTRFGEIAMVSEEWGQPVEVIGVNDAHHLQLSLFATNLDAAGCYPDHWGPHRFERIGALFLIPAHHKFHARSECRSQRSVICRLDPAELSDWLYPGIAWTNRRLAAGLDISNDNIRKLMCRLADEMRNSVYANEAMIDLLIPQIGIELSRYLLPLEDGVAAGGLAPWRLRRIDEYLVSNAAGATLAEMSRLCNLSIRHLARAFKVSRGCSLGEYIAAQKIEQARRLLDDGMPIKEAAFAIGFPTPTNFSAAFRRATGETPRQYQQRGSRALRDFTQP